VESIEFSTGYNFLDALPVSIQNVIEKYKLLNCKLGVVMKKFTFVVFLSVLLLVGCETKQPAKVSEYIELEDNLISLERYTKLDDSFGVGFMLVYNKLSEQEKTKGFNKYPKEFIIDEVKKVANS